VCPYHLLIKDSRFFAALLVFDQILAAEARVQGCPCGGLLHQSNYRRKPRGGPRGLSDAVSLRFSFCCNQDGCRRRATPTSVRFLARRVYFSSVFVLVSTMTHGLTMKRAAQLRGLVGVSLRTLKRWKIWWLDTFVETPVWRAGKARFMPPVDEALLPGSLRDRYEASSLSSIMNAVLEFLRPLSTSSDPYSTRFSRG